MIKIGIMSRARLQNLTQKRENVLKNVRIEEKYRSKKILVRFPGFSVNENCKRGRGQSLTIYPALIPCNLVPIWYLLVLNV